MDRTPRPGELYRHFENGIYQIVTVAKHFRTGEKLVIYQAMFGDFGVRAMPVDEFVGKVDGEKYPDATQRYRFEKMAGLEIALAKNTQGKSGVQEQAAAQGKSGMQEQAAAQGKSPAREMPGVREAGIHGRSPRETGCRQGGVRADSVPVSKRQPLQNTAREWREKESAAPVDPRRQRQLEEREHRRGQFKKPEKDGKRTSENDGANPNLLKFLDADTYEERYQVLTEIRDEMTDRLIDDIAVVLDVVIPEGSVNDRFMQLRSIILTRQKYETNRFR